MIWNLLLILLLVALNGFFVATEFTVITPRKSRVRLQTEEGNQTLGTNFNDPNYDTIAGYLLGHLDHIPVQGETIKLDDGIQLQVAAMDGLRISKIQIWVCDLHAV